LITAIELALLADDAEHHRKAYLHASRRNWGGEPKLMELARTASSRLRSAFDTVLTLASAGCEADLRAVELATLARAERDAGRAYRQSLRRKGISTAEFSALVAATRAFRDAVARVFAEDEAAVKGGGA
jgi:hypothetical protein